MNWTFLLDTLRRLSAMPTRSDTVMPLSVVIEAAASVTTESSRSGFDSSPLSQHPLDHLRGHELVPLDPFQVRPGPDVLAGTPEGQGLDPVDVILTGREGEARHRVVHVERDADVDAAEVVDDLDEAEHADPDEVVDEDAGRLLDRLPQAHRAARRQQRVDLHVAVGVGLLARIARAGGALVHRHHGVARNAHRGHQMPARRQVHDHDRVGVVGLVAAGVQDVLLVRVQALTAVIAVDQDVFRGGAVLRGPLAEFGPRDVDPGDAVVDGAVFQVGGQRARGEDDDRPDRDPSEHVPLTLARRSAPRGPHA